MFDAAVFYSIMDVLERKNAAEPGFCAVIVDPHGLAEFDAASLAVLQSQLAGAGSIIWNKCDLPGVPDLTECTALLHTLLPDLPPIETSPTHDFTDFALLQTRTGRLRAGKPSVFCLRQNPPPLFRGGKIVCRKPSWLP